MSTMYEALLWEQWDIKIRTLSPLWSLWSIWRYRRGDTEKQRGSRKDKYPQKELSMPIEFYSKVRFTIPRKRYLGPNSNEEVGFEMVPEDWERFGCVECRGHLSKGVNQKKHNTREGDKFVWSRWFSVGKDGRLVRSLGTGMHCGVYCLRPSYSIP